MISPMISPQVTTTIGFGSLKQGTAGVHGAPLGHADLAQVKRQHNFAEAEFFSVPSDVAETYRKCGLAGAAKHREWEETLASYSKAHPELATEFKRRMARELPEGWREQLPRCSPPRGRRVTTTHSGEQCVRHRPRDGLALTAASHLRPAFHRRVPPPVPGTPLRTRRSPLASRPSSC